MKILALDLGDKWVGSAISDGLGITCKPYQTVKRNKLETFLDKTLPEENINKVVVGYPKTLGGNESIQTKKIVSEKKELEARFHTANYTPVEWILWDERLSSKRAEISLGKKYKDKKGKQESHSIAAAFILQTYLDYISFNKK